MPLRVSVWKVGLSQTLPLSFYPYAHVCQRFVSPFFQPSFRLGKRHQEQLFLLFTLSKERMLVGTCFLLRPPFFGGVFFSLFAGK